MRLGRRAKRLPTAVCSWLQVVIGSLKFPKVNEPQEVARDRFQRAISRLAKKCAGALLVVTHGDAVGAVIEHLKSCTVYQVDTAGYVVLQRDPVKGALRVLDASGVSWID